MSFANRIVLKRAPWGSPRSSAAAARAAPRRRARSPAAPPSLQTRAPYWSGADSARRWAADQQGRGASCAVPAVNSIWASSDRPTRRGNASPTSVSTCAERGGVSVPRSRRGLTLAPVIRRTERPSPSSARRTTRCRRTGRPPRGAPSARPSEHERPSEAAMARPRSSKRTSEMGRDDAVSAGRCSLERAHATRSHLWIASQAAPGELDRGFEHPQHGARYPPQHLRGRGWRVKHARAARAAANTRTASHVASAPAPAYPAC